MPCYRCGARQVDPEPGKPSPYGRGVVGEHQVLICPACAPAATADLTRCARCGGAALIRRLDQIECLDCRLIRNAESAPEDAGMPGRPRSGPDRPGSGPAGPGPGLAAEVARALERMRGAR